jgi:hypothetical protein
VFRVRAPSSTLMSTPPTTIHPPWRPFLQDPRDGTYYHCIYGFWAPCAIQDITSLALAFAAADYESITTPLTSPSLNNGFYTIGLHVRLYTLHCGNMTERIAQVSEEDASHAIEEPTYSKLPVHMPTVDSLALAAQSGFSLLGPAALTMIRQPDTADEDSMNSVDFHSAKLWDERQTVLARPLSYTVQVMRFSHLPPERSPSCKQKRKIACLPCRRQKNACLQSWPEGSPCM